MKFKAKRESIQSEIATLSYWYNPLKSDVTVIWKNKKQNKTNKILMNDNKCQ